MSFYTSLTGLNAATTELAVTSNNIANSATAGFKRSTASFGDIFATSPVVHRLMFDTGAALHICPPGFHPEFGLFQQLNTPSVSGVGNHPLTDAGIAKFLADAEKVPK